MPKESEFWRNNVSRLKSFGVIERIEDALKCGVADCVYCLTAQGATGTGWIELKRLLVFPKRAAIRLPHFSLDQVNYLERWGRAGAGAFLLAQVADEYFLFSWRDVRAVHEGLLRNEFTMRAKVHLRGAFPAGRIAVCLTRI
jgi:hypothetical protein